MKRFGILVLFAFSLCRPIANAQNTYIDSVKAELKKTNSEFERIAIYVELADQLEMVSSFSEAMNYVNAAIALSEKSIKRSDGKSKTRDLLAKAYVIRGIIYENTGSPDNALKDYLDALKIREQTKDELGQAMAYGNIGNVYSNKGVDELSLDYYLKALKIFEKLDKKVYMAFSYVNIGLIYSSRKEYATALDYYNNSIKNFTIVNEEMGMANALNNIGLVHLALKSYDSAIVYYENALSIYEKISDESGSAAAIINIGDAFLAQKKFSSAEEYFQKGLNIAMNVGHLDWQKNAYKGLSQLAMITSDWKRAYEYFELYTLLKDSIFNEETSLNLVSLQNKYEMDKKAKEIDLLNKEKLIAKQKEKLAESDSKKQKSLLYFSIAILGLVLVFSVFMYRRWKYSLKQNKLIASQKKHVDLAYEQLGVKNDIIESKNKALTDSILYAKRIQDSLLPSDKYIERNLKSGKK